MTSIARKDLWNAYFLVKSQPDALNQLVKFVLDKLGGDSIDPEWEKNAKAVLRRFLEYCNRSYKSVRVSYKNSVFLEQNKNWLSGYEIFPELPNSPKPGTSTSEGTDKGEPSKRGRPKEESFASLKEDSKRKRTKEMRALKGADEITYAAGLKLKEEGQANASKIVQKVLKSSPRTVSMIFLNISNIKRTPSGNIDDGYPREFSLEEAIVHQIQCDFSKEQYVLNRKRLIEKNCKVFPSYEKLTTYKLQCLPSNLVVSEVKASVNLQDILNHTVERIISVQEEVFKSEKLIGNKLELVSKLGFDGSSNPAQYNQLWKDSSEASDSNMVLTALVPLLLHQSNATEETVDIVNVIWMNQKPSSTVLCRPIELEFTKETAAYIKSRSQELHEACNNLQDTIVKVNGVEYAVKHTVLITMVDGKVTSAMTNTGSATCNVCKATPSQMNNIDAVLQRKSDLSALNYGLSVLHLNIRFLEYFMNIAVRRGVAEKCYGKYSKEEQAAMDAKHKYICKRLKNEIGLVIDQPSSRGGNTNTGNNARRFFEKKVQVSGITGLDMNLLDKCSIVMRTFSCGYAINTVVFKQFCVQLARDLVKTYSFWYMPAAIHLALIHGAEMIQTLPVPIGMLSEEPLESSHKIVRYTRLHHTRKTGRKETMTDLFKGLLIQSDPVIASLRKPAKPRGQISNDVVAMLISPEPFSAYRPAIIDPDTDEDEM